MSRAIIIVVVGILVGICAYVGYGCVKQPVLEPFVIGASIRLICVEERGYRFIEYRSEFYLATEQAQRVTEFVRIALEDGFTLQERAADLSSWIAMCAIQ